MHILEKNVFLSIYSLVSGLGIKKIHTFFSYEFLPTPELELFVVEFLSTQELELFMVEFLIEIIHGGIFGIIRGRIFNWNYLWWNIYQRHSWKYSRSNIY